MPLTNDGFRWHRGPWSMVCNLLKTLISFTLVQCSRTCQTGHQGRIVTCRSDADTIVPDSECDPNTRPRSKRFCNGHIKCCKFIAQLHAIQYVPVKVLWLMQDGNCNTRVGQQTYTRRPTQVLHFHSALVYTVRYKSATS